MQINTKNIEKIKKIIANMERTYPMYKDKPTEGEK